MPGVLSLDIPDRGESDASTRSMASDSPSGVVSIVGLSSKERRVPL